MIKTFDSEFGVTTVAEMYRTGKSYLLNRILLNKQKDFQYLQQWIHVQKDFGFGQNQFIVIQIQEKDFQYY